LCSDDVIRLFVDWLRIYHELHFALIRSIYKTPGITRYEIWVELCDENLPREDSPEADLYKFIFRELSTGGVIRIAGNTTEDGRFLKQRTIKRSPRGSINTMKSAFEDTKQYVLTELGKQFVHYTMNDVVTELFTLFCPVGLTGPAGGPVVRRAPACVLCNDWVIRFAPSHFDLAA
jgi:hypothetical protein